MAALDSRHRFLKRAYRIEIINSIALKMLEHTMHPTSEEYTAVCRLLTDRYPFLKDTAGNGHVSSHIKPCAFKHVSLVTQTPSPS